MLASATTRGEVGGSRRHRIREKPNSNGRASNECRLATSSSPLTIEQAGENIVAAFPHRDGYVLVSKTRVVYLPLK